MWYGLKKDGVIVEIRRFSHQPCARDFGKKYANDYSCTVVVVRIREVGTLNIA